MGPHGLLLQVQAAAEATLPRVTGDVFIYSPHTIWATPKRTVYETKSITLSERSCRAVYETKASAFRETAVLLNGAWLSNWSITQQWKGAVTADLSTGPVNDKRKDKHCRPLQRQRWEASANRNGGHKSARRTVASGLKGQAGSDRVYCSQMSLSSIKYRQTHDYLTSTSPPPPLSLSLFQTITSYLFFPLKERLNYNNGVLKHKIMTGKFPPSLAAKSSLNQSHSRKLKSSLPV